MEGVSRRHLLRVLGIGGLSAVAGCGQGQPDPSPTERSPSPSPVGSPTQTPTDTQSTTAEDSTAPELTNYNATPQQNAEQLMVRLQGRDDQELDRARIWYGDRTLEEAVDGKTGELQGTLDDVLQQEPEEYGTVHFLLEDAAGNVAEKTHRPDEERPSVESFTAYTREDAGEFGVTLHGGDETALRTLELAVGDQTYTVDVLGEETGSIDEVVTTDHPDLGDAITPFQKNKLTAFLRDWAGNETGRVETPYVRKFDTMDDARLDIGAVYISQAGDFFDRCFDQDGHTRPTVGIYGDDPIPTEVSTKHIDQMTGHGISRMVYDYAGKRRDEDRLTALLDSELIEQVEIEPFYTKIPLIRNMDKSWKEEIFPRDLPFLRDTVLRRENVSTYDGRPVVSTWNFIHFARPGSEAREKVMDEFGSYEQFVEDIRSHLRVDDTDPFLIIGKGSVTNLENSEWGELVRQFDGATNWFPGKVLEQGKVASWDEAYEDINANFQATKEFTEKHGMEFIPTIFPGFNGKEDACKQDRRVLPRGTDQFRRMLDIADEYRTTDRITIASWNAWPEGHQIEPGTFQGNNYGTAYLDMVKNFQQNGSE